MKRERTLGLALAAVCLVPLLGTTSSAQATVLCKETATPCGTTTSVDASLKAGTTSTLATTGGQLINTCTGSTVIGATSSTTGSVDSVVATADLTWSGCSFSTSTLAGGTLEVHRIEGTDNATVTAKGFEVTSNVGASCTYGAGKGVDLGVLEGGEAPTININVVLGKLSGGFMCPVDARWKGEYMVTSPLPLFLETAGGQTVLCETTTTPCNSEPEPDGSLYYPAGTEIDATLEAGTLLIMKVTEGSYWNVCEGSSLQAEISSGGGSGKPVVTEPISLALTSCAAGTFSTLSSGPIEVQHVTGTDDGTVAIQNLELTWKYQGISCAFASGEGAHVGTLTGGAAVLHVELPLSKVSGTSLLCRNSTILDASYSFNSPQSLFVEPG